jgi:hypothetical protein
VAGTFFQCYQVLVENDLRKVGLKGRNSSKKSLKPVGGVSKAQGLTGQGE